MTVLISRQRIAEAVARLAGEMRRDRPTGPPVLVGVLHGAFVFLADLARALDLPVEIGFVGLSSYGSSTASSGRMELFHELRTDITGRDVVLVEDIIDSGHSLAFLCDYLRQRRPASLRVCCLLDKPACRPGGRCHRLPRLHHPQPVHRRLRHGFQRAIPPPAGHPRAGRNPYVSVTRTC